MNNIRYLLMHYSNINNYKDLQNQMLASCSSLTLAAGRLGG